jgi:hypothetical protein
MRAYAKSTLSLYFMFFLIISVTTLLLWLKADIESKMEEEMLKMQAKVSQCTMEYRENHCEYSTRPPALRDFCIEREVCMQVDPMVQTRKFSVLAKLLGEVLNDFSEPITYKTLGVISVFVLMGFVLMKIAQEFGAKVPRRSSKMTKTLD